jgi:GntR family transcriptional regulator
MLDGFAVQNNGIPIYVQLREQILALIGRGALKPGSQLPTMREVAVALKIDLNTVQRAYAELERDGVLAKLRGVGTFVTETLPAPRNARKQTEAFAARIAALAKGQGIDLDELAAALAKLAGRIG